MGIGEHILVEQPGCLMAVFHVFPSRSRAWVWVRKGWKVKISTGVCGRLGV